MRTVLLLLLALPAALAASWADYEEAFPAFPCQDGWMACKPGGTDWNPGLQPDSAGLMMPADSRVGFFDLQATAHFNPWARLSEYEMGAPEPEPAPAPPVADADTEAPAPDGAADAGDDEREMERPDDGVADAGADADDARMDRPEPAPDEGDADEGSRMVRPDPGTPDEGSRMVRPDPGTPDEGDPDEGDADEGDADEGSRMVRPDPGTPDEGDTDEGKTDEGDRMVRPGSGDRDEGSRMVRPEPDPEPEPEPEPDPEPDTDAVADADLDTEADKGPVTCDNLVALEMPAMMGRLGPEQIECLEGRYAAADKQTDKRKISLVLINNANASDRNEWARLVDRHLQDVDRSDPDLTYAYALHQHKIGNPEKAIRWADVALERKDAWSGSTYTSRVYSLYKIRAEAAAKAWKAAESKHASAPSEATRQATDTTRGRVKTLAREWYEYAKAAGKDTTTAMDLCVSAAGTAEYCSGG